MAFDKNKSMMAAQKFFQKGQYDRAIREYEKIIKEEPKDIKVHQKLGDLYAREGKKTEAISEYNFVANFYSEDGFYLRAIAVFKQILKLDPARIQINLKLAELYHKQNLIGDAIKQFQLVYSFYDRKGDTGKALDTLDKMAEMAPSNLSLRMKLADAYYKNKFIDRSLDEYVKIGEQLKKEERVGDLVKLYERLIKHHPDRVDMVSILAEIYLNVNKLDFANSRIDMGLRVLPNDKKLLYMKSRVLIKKEDHEGSIKILNELLKINPEFVEAKEELAFAYEKLGKTDLLGKLYTQLMIYYQGKQQHEKAGHYKALYANLTSTVDDITGTEDVSGLGGVASDVSTIDVIEDVVEVDIVEAQEMEVLEVEVLEEVTEIEEAAEPTTFEAVTAVEEDISQEVIDDAGRMIMLKVDTYVKYGQYKEAADVLKGYNDSNSEYISPKKRLAELYLEIAKSSEDTVEYNKYASETYSDISSLAKKKGMSNLADDAQQKAMELDPGLDTTIETGEIDTDGVESFDVVSDDEVVIEHVEEMEIPDSIEIGDMGAEPIEISVDSDGFMEGGVEFSTEEIVVEPVDIGEISIDSGEIPIDSGEVTFDSGIETREGKKLEGGLISMTPEDDSLAEGEEYFDLRKELEGVVLDDEMSLESKGGAGLLGEDEHFSFEDVFDEFKKGVEKQFGSEDYDTHYNLGIAYREMELFNDAIKSFNISVNDPNKRVDSFVMMGVTYRDMGEFEKSIDYFREALDTPGMELDEKNGLLYELAFSYEANDDIDQAYPIYKSISKEKPDFRDTEDRIKALKDLVSENAEVNIEVEREEKKEKDDSKPQKKKDRISYV